MRKRVSAILVCLATLQSTGCSNLPLSGISPEKMLRIAKEKSVDAHKPDSNPSSAASKIANPPARTLRFDGHEIVLGESENQALDVGALVSKLDPLIQQQRFQSAATLILRHRESAERLLLERWATESNEAVIQLVAEVLSRRSTRLDTSWKALPETAIAHKSSAIHYQNSRNAFAEELRNNDPSSQTAEQLLQASLKVNHPLIRLDALRLLGLRELVGGRHAWAESQFRQAIEIALSSGNPLVAAELWLTVAESARRNNQLATATTAWSNAVNLHLISSKYDQPLDVSFWLLADKTRPEAANWPIELGVTLAPIVQHIGCMTESGAEAVLWGSVAQSQFERGEFQPALVNFKKAETLSQGVNVMWLRIAQARCLAGMGQSPAASAILSGPAASSDASVSAAATATMGSIKLQTGAYQQGAQLLQKALAKSSTSAWPSRNQSLADLAIAQLIFGDTDKGLIALHEAQSLLENSGDRAQLVQSLENELRLLEHEHRGQESAAIRKRIVQLEQL